MAGDDSQFGGRVAITVNGNLFLTPTEADIKLKRAGFSKGRVPITTDRLVT